MINKEHYYKRKLYEERKKREPQIPNISIPKYDIGCEVTSAEASEKLLDLVEEQLDTLDIEKAKNESNKTSSKMNIIKCLLAITACSVISVVVYSGINIADQVIQDYRTLKQPYSTSWNNKYKFIEKVVKTIWDNESLTDVEKAKIATGYRSFLNDYEYLLGKEDKQNLIYLLDNLTVNREKKMLFDDKAKFSGKNMNFAYGLIDEYDSSNLENQKLNELSKESIAILGDGFIFNGLDAFSWINEGVKQAINEKNFNGEKIQISQNNSWIYKELRKLSFIIDKELILKCFANDSYSLFIEEVSSKYPGLDKSDLIGYLSSLNIIYGIEKAFPDCGLYSTLEDSVVNLFYSKLFKQRYSVDYETNPFDTYGNNSYNYNFLDDSVVISSDDFTTYHRVPVKNIGNLTNHEDLDNYPIVSRYCGNTPYKYLTLPEDYKNMEEQGFSSDTYLRLLVYDRLSNSENDEVQRRNESLFSATTYANLEDFLYLYVHNLFLSDMTPEQMACHIKSALSFFINYMDIHDTILEDHWVASEKPLVNELTKDELANRFGSYVINALKNAGLEDVIYYLCNTDINFKSFTGNYEESTLPETFNEIVAIENPTVIDGCIGINVDEPVREICFYGKSIDFVEITDQQTIDTLNKKFGVNKFDKKRYFSIQLPAEEISTIDYKYIDIYIYRKSTVAGIEERKNEKFTYEYKYKHYSDIEGVE